MGYQVGGWWEPIRAAVWRFAGAKATDDNGVQHVLGSAEIKDDPNGDLHMPDKIVITYVSRQGAPRRKLLEDDHKGLVMALQELVATKGSSWELRVIRAERMTKDEQILAVAKSTVRFSNAFLSRGTMFSLYPFFDDVDSSRCSREWVNPPCVHEAKSLISRY